MHWLACDAQIYNVACVYQIWGCHPCIAFIRTPSPYAKSQCAPVHRITFSFSKNALFQLAYSLFRNKISTKHFASNFQNLLFLESFKNKPVNAATSFESFAIQQFFFSLFSYKIFYVLLIFTTAN